MALILPDAQAMSRTKKPLSSSPFYSRAYGGYTKDQETFYLDHIPLGKNSTILDPMGGQGFLLANLALRGSEVWLGDINPAMSLMASLRSPEMIKNAEKLVEWVEEQLASFRPRATSSRLEYIDNWIAPDIKKQLEYYRVHFQIGASPFSNNLAFWRLPLKKRFAAAIPLLAARDIACFQSSDNLTWIKPGGLQREITILAPIKSALAAWRQFAEGHRPLLQSPCKGRVVARRMNAAEGYFADCPKVDSVVTSPPYANRLDYTRMWAPEAQLAAALWEEDVARIQAAQIGSNVVRGMSDLSAIERELPRPINEALTAIKNDGDYASSGYYYPFFRNYAVSMMKTMHTLAAKVSKNGTAVIFVRDTVRKDVLFPTGLLVERVFQDRGFRLVGKHRKIVKQHVGLRRRSSTSGFYGIGQLEWWLAFQRTKP